MHALWLVNQLWFIGPLQDPVTWYKITYSGEQVAQWDLKNNAPAFVLEVPLRNLSCSTNIPSGESAYKP